MTIEWERRLLIAVTIIGLSLVALPLFAGTSVVATSLTDDDNSTTTESVEDQSLETILENSDGEVELVLWFTDSSDSSSTHNFADDDLGPVSQQSFEEFVQTTGWIEIEQRFDAVNAALVTVDSDEAAIDELREHDEVDHAHENFDIEPPEAESVKVPETDVEVASETNDFAWGLERINVPDVWDEYDTRGGGVEVAVLDTGVDTNHPDIDIDTENWAEFDRSGAFVDSDPYDTRGHGTQVSGIVVGGNESGKHIGVAPNATLYHGGVFTSRGSSVTSLVAGMNWAIEEDVDVIIMSAGLDGYSDRLAQPVHKAEEEGIIFVASTGNGGEGISATPANAYESIAVGASIPTDEVHPDSSGERIVTPGAWSDPPNDWPDEYVVPDVVAPGKEIKTADLGGEYSYFGDTSAAAPHVAGAAALLRSEDPELTSTGARDVLTATATKSADAPSEKDIRYGDGIVDVFAAMELLSDTVTITGIVSDEEGTPIERATVESSLAESVTDTNGTYSVLAESGNQTIDASGFGVEASESIVNATEDETKHDIEVSAEPEVELVTDALPHVEPGEVYELEFRVAAVDSHTTTVVDGTLENATLEGSDFDREETLSDVTRGERVTVTVVTDPDETGTLTLEHEFQTTTGESIEVRTATTRSLPDPVTVGEEGDLETVQEALDVVVKGTTIHLIDDEYTLDAEDNLTVTTPVTLTAADSTTPELTITGSPDDPNDAGLTVEANETTISSIVINGSNLGTGISVTDAENVQINNNTVAGDDVETGISIDSIAGMVTGNTVTVNSTAVSVGGVTERIIENRLEATDADLEIRPIAVVRIVTENEFEGNGSGIAVREDGYLNKVTENQFSGDSGIDGSGILETSSRNDFSAVNTTPISSDWGTASRLDYYGERGPQTGDLVGDVDYELYLTAPPAEVPADDEDVEQFGYHLELEAKETTAVSFPGPMEHDLEGTFGEFNGSIYTYDTGEREWELVTNGNESVDALDSYVVIPEEDVTVHVEFASTDEVSAPSEASVEEGWNLVGAPMSGDIETAYEATTTDLVRALQLFADPSESPLEEASDDWLLYRFESDETDVTVSPHSGYFVYATEAGGIASNVYSGITLGDIETALISESEEPTAAADVEQSGANETAAASSGGD